MKNRDYKDSGRGAYYHIYNRGNARQDIFRDEEDFQFFLLRLRQNLFPEEARETRIVLLPGDSFSLICYCLMPNHFHLLLRQNSDISSSKLLLRVCTSYSMYFNKRYQNIGHVFQDQFKQITIDRNDYLLWLSAYIHLNPVVASLVRDPQDYLWSSYGGFLNEQKLQKLSFCEPSVILNQFQNRKAYASFVQQALPALKERKDLGHLYLE